MQFLCNFSFIIFKSIWKLGLWQKSIFLKRSHRDLSIRTKINRAVYFFPKKPNPKLFSAFEKDPKIFIKFKKLSKEKFKGVWFGILKIGLKIPSTKKSSDQNRSGQKLPRLKNFQIKKFGDQNFLRLGITKAQWTCRGGKMGKMDQHRKT